MNREKEEKKLSAIDIQESFWQIMARVFFTTDCNIDQSAYEFDTFVLDDKIAIIVNGNN